MQIASMINIFTVDEDISIWKYRFISAQNIRLLLSLSGWQNWAENPLEIIFYEVWGIEAVVPLRAKA